MGNRICGLKRCSVEERLTRPSQRLVRQQSDVDYKRVRHLIKSRKLAPFFDACDDQESRCTDLEECPICFLYYPSLNRSKCCAKGICTECFLQMMPSDSSRPAHCPFCKANSYAVQYRGPRTSEEKQCELEEEQKVIEAKMRIQHESENSNQVISLHDNYYNSIQQVMVEKMNNIDLVPNGTGFLNSYSTNPLNTSFRKELYIDLEEILMPEAIIWESLQDLTSCTNGINGERETHELGNEGTRDSMELKNQMLNLCLTFFA